MTGPVERDLASLAPLDITSSNPEARHDTVKRSSVSRRHSRRGALAILIGTAAVVVVERRSAFAATAEDEEPASAEGGDTPPVADAPPADGAAPASEPAASAPPAPAAPTEAAVATPPVAAKTYTVAAGDTMYSIAKKHGVSVDAVLWANDLSDANVLKQGQKLTIPPATGKLHVVKDGDTLDALATTYGVSKAGIAAVNGLTEDATLKEKQRLLIPVKASEPAPLTAASSTAPVPIPPSDGASGAPTPPQASTLSAMMSTPSVLTTTGVPTVTVSTKKVPKLAMPLTLDPPKIGISRGFQPGHTGLDIYAPTGTPIKAAAGGTVKMAANEPTGFAGYGWIVIIDHGDGISTWYAHCSKFNVAAGDKVKTGDTIALVGATGRAYGSHLHFELRLGATAVDPRLALP